MNQLFRISSETWKTLSPEEIQATIDGLREMGLYRLPYEAVDIELVDQANNIRWFREEDATLWNDEVFFKDGKLIDPYLMGTMCICLTGVTLSPQGDDYLIGVDKIEVVSSRGWKSDVVLDAFNLSNAINGLIALLATRNVVKTTKEDKLARLGIGIRRKHKHRYITTISLPPEMEADADHPPRGGHKAPHWRRGHIRRQHYGPKLAFEKRVWIEPTFVNADPEWVDTREAYNVSLGS